jgi:hypothetical protein
VSLVRYELGFYIPEDDILHNHSSERPKNLKSYMPPFVTCFFLFGLVPFVPLEGDNTTEARQ